METTNYKTAIEARIAELKAEKDKVDRKFNEAIKSLRASAALLDKGIDVTLGINAIYNTSLSTFYDHNAIVDKED